MWFEKSSVAYKVSNHRLIALRQQHGEIEAGRRYTNASYMYRFVNVCVFCRVSLCVCVRCAAGDCLQNSRGLWSRGDRVPL